LGWRKLLRGLVVRNRATFSWWRTSEPAAPPRTIVSCTVRNQILFARNKSGFIPTAPFSVYFSIHELSHLFFISFTGPNHDLERPGHYPQSCARNPTCVLSPIGPSVLYNSPANVGAYVDTSHPFNPQPLHLRNVA